MTDDQQSSGTQTPTSISEDLRRLAEETYKHNRAANVGWRLHKTINLMRKHCSVPMIDFLRGVIMDSFDGDYLHNARMAENGQWFIDTYIDIGKGTITAAEFMFQSWEELAIAKMSDRATMKLEAIWSLPEPYSDICYVMFDDIVSLSKFDYHYLRSMELSDDLDDDDANIPAPSKLHSFIDIADVLL